MTEREKRQGWGRRRGEGVDENIGEVVTPLTNRQRLETLERVVRRHRLEAFAMYALACVLLVALAFVLAEVAQQRMDRRADVDRAERVRIEQEKLICQRQEVITERLIDTKQKIRGTDSTLRRLVLLAVAPRPGAPPPDAASRRFTLAFREEARNLSVQIQELREGEATLRGELNAVDCDAIAP